MKKKIFFWFIVLLAILSCEEEGSLFLKANKIQFESKFDTIDYRTAIINTKIINHNNVTILRYGHCWSKELNPTLENESTSCNYETNSISSEIKNLEHNTQYYVRTFIEFEDIIYYSDSNAIFKTKEILVPDLNKPIIQRVSKDYVEIVNEVQNLNGGKLISQGICWSTNQYPTISDNVCYDERETKGYKCLMQELEIGKKYWIRSFAINEIGSGYSEPILLDYDWGIIQVQDYDGNWYNTLKIGSQVWLRENLKTKHFANGEPISDGTEIEIDLNDHSSKYMFNPNRDENLSDKYGLLYNWAAAMNGSASSELNPSGVQGVCPDGWHLPSPNEFSDLIWAISNVGSSDAGGKLKEEGYDNWFQPNTGATNESGFTALPAGYFYNHTLYDERHTTYFWLSTESDSQNSKTIGCSYNYASTWHNDKLKITGYSVRCLKD